MPEGCTLSPKGPRLQQGDVSGEECGPMTLDTRTCTVCGEPYQIPNYPQANPQIRYYCLPCIESMIQARAEMEEEDGL
jgi:hypothetical protein